MISRNNASQGEAINKEQKLGTIGYLAIFACSLAAVMLAPVSRLPWAAGGCLLVAWVVFPRSFQALMRLRWLVLTGLLCLPPIFLVGEIDRSLVGIPYSSEGVLSAVQILLRILVVLVSVQGLPSSVDISSVAGLWERRGLQGLGFSVGVAMNLLPSLQQSTQNAWRSLQMRGGLRKRRLRSLRLLVVTVIAGAIGRAEEIALAAEARAFTPDQARSMPVKMGKWDWPILVLAIVSVCGLLVIS